MADPQSSADSTRANPFPGETGVRFAWAEPPVSHCPPPTFHEADKDYITRLEHNKKEALGFLKDWVTSILQIETAIAGALGATLVLKVPADLRLTKVETLVLLAAILLFGASIMCGVTVLNLLPGAVQRKPNSERARTSDIYSIRNEKTHATLYGWSWWFRWLFFAGLAAIPVFAVLWAFVDTRGWLPGAIILNPSRPWKPDGT